MHDLNLTTPLKPVSQLTRDSKAKKQLLIDSGLWQNNVAEPSQLYSFPSACPTSRVFSEGPPI
jgi:hypothetical protein